MRLQWWIDALVEIQSGAAVRKHEVTTPLSEVLTADTAQMLKTCVEARRRDAHRERLASKDDLAAYVEQTAGTLHRVAVRALGEQNYDGWASSVGSALGLANYLLAVPAFLERGQNPLPDMTEAEMRALLLDHLTKVVGGTGTPTKLVRTVDLAAWRAKGILARALKDQSAIVEGRLGGSEFSRRAGLLWRSIRG
jgi:phytoene/squalene synthetase